MKTLGSYSINMLSYLLIYNKNKYRFLISILILTINLLNKDKNFLAILYVLQQYHPKNEQSEHHVRNVFSVLGSLSDYDKN